MTLLLTLVADWLCTGCGLAWLPLLLSSLIVVWMQYSDLVNLLLCGSPITYAMLWPIDGDVDPTIWTIVIIIVHYDWLYGDSDDVLLTLFIDRIIIETDTCRDLIFIGNYYCWYSVAFSIELMAILFIVLMLCGSYCVCEMTVIIDLFPYYNDGVGWLLLLWNYNADIGHDYYSEGQFWPTVL